MKALSSMRLQVGLVARLCRGNRDSINQIGRVQYNAVNASYLPLQYKFMDNARHFLTGPVSGRDTRPIAPLLVAQGRPLNPIPTFRLGENSILNNLYALPNTNHEQADERFWHLFRNSPILQQIFMQTREFSGGPAVNRPTPVGRQNPRPRGIVPFGEDYGGYNEDRHEEYENEATTWETKIRRYKKMLSSIVFLSIFILVMWARNYKQKTVDEFTKNATFLPNDYQFTGSHNSFATVLNATGTESVVLPSSIVRDGTINFIQSMELRPDDVIVASFPKTGTTICQEIVYLMKNDLDFKKASANVLEDRFPFLEYPYPGVKSVDKMKSPRLIKTHLPYAFLPKHAENAKIIYCVRNPKDTVVSYYHFTRMLSVLGFTGSFNEFLDRFMKDQLPYSPFFSHIESYMKRKDDPNILIVVYEEFIKDPAAVIQKIASFLDKSYTPEEISKLVEHTSFHAMASNSSVNYRHWDDLGLHKDGEAPFMRKGQVGDYKNWFNNQKNQEFEKWILDNNKLNINFDFSPCENQV